MRAPFAFDYGGVRRWVKESGLDAVTIEETGRVVFATFDTNPAVAAGVVFAEASFDEVADGAVRVAPELWSDAAARLRAVRRPGTTSCLVVCTARLGARSRVVPWEWTVDGERVSAPHVPGPAYAGTIDERPPLAEGVPFVIAVRPGARRLAGMVRVHPDGAPATDIAFELGVEVAEGRAIDVLLTRDPRAPGALVARLAAPA